VDIWSSNSAPTLSNHSRIHINRAFYYIKISFHSRSQASQQACVCDAYWYGNMVGTHSAKFGEGLRNSQSSRTCWTFANTHEILGIVARYGNKKPRFAMLLCFGGTVLVLLFYVRGSKVWYAQLRNPLEMLVGTSSAHFPYLHNKGGSQWRQLRSEWKPQHRSGNNSQEIATPTCCEPLGALRPRRKLTLTLSCKALLELLSPALWLLLSCLFWVKQQSNLNLLVSKPM